MAKDQFAIERPRRISISIPGYDAAANLKAQATKRAEKRRRDEKRKAKPQQQAVLTSPVSAASPLAVETEIEALARAASTQQTDFDRELAAAFLGGEGNEAHHADE